MRHYLAIPAEAKREQERSGRFWRCARKAPYPSLRAAWAKVNTTRREGWQGLEAYYCPRCKAYHLGHPGQHYDFMKHLNFWGS